MSIRGRGVGVEGERYLARRRACVGNVGILLVGGLAKEKAE